MFGLFGTVGSILRNVLALGFAAIWGLSSMMLDLKQIADLPWSSAGGLVLVLALVGASVIAGFVALVLYLRDGGRKKRADGAQAGETVADFDPDQIIALHMARRAAPVARPVVYRSRPAQGFGRRIR
jgi:hypothetical protein